MMVLGIDPGLSITGYGLVEAVKDKLKLIEAGEIRSKASYSLERRLLDLYNGLEDVAKVMLPPYLERHYHVKFTSGEVEGEEFERRFFTVNSVEVEVNLYGEGTMNGEEVVILGECKSRIYRREVDEFARTIERVEGLFQKRAIKVMFGFYIHPSAQGVAQRGGE